MAKKKENIQDILDSINEDIETIREKVEELEIITPKRNWFSVVEWGWAKRW